LAVTATLAKIRADALLAVTPQSAEAQELVTRARAAGRIPIIVKLRVPTQPDRRINGATLAEAQRQSIAAAQASFLGRLGAGASMIQRFTDVPLVTLNADAETLQTVLASPEVESVQESLPVPPLLPDSVPLINGDKAWAGGYDGTGYQVAIVDTGVDSSHPFLTGKIVAEACFSGTDPNSTSLCPSGNTSQTGTGAAAPCVMAGCDHGTHVAGIAAGRGSGSTNFSGVARDANIVAVLVFSKFTDTLPRSPCAAQGLSSPCLLSSTTDQISALQFVSGQSNVAAVNLSLGGGKYTTACSDHPLRPSVSHLINQSVAVVAASGNDGYRDGIAGPACIPEVISVGNTTKTDDVKSSSNSASFLEQGLRPA
jgi:subtilisin family serine protease